MPKNKSFLIEIESDDWKFLNFLNFLFTQLNSAQLVVENNKPIKLWNVIIFLFCHWAFFVCNFYDSVCSPFSFLFVFYEFYVTTVPFFVIQNKNQQFMREKNFLSATLCKIYRKNSLSSLEIYVALNKG